MSLKEHFPSRQRDPTGTYQIWHRCGNGYRHAASVDTNLMGALVLPNFGPGHAWSKNVTYTEAWQRPTTYGDKLVDPNGVALEIYRDKPLQMTAVRETTMPREAYGTRLEQQPRTQPHPKPKGRGM